MDKAKIRRKEKCTPHMIDCLNDEEWMRMKELKGKQVNEKNKKLNGMIEDAML